eukprot:6199263-Pleurochrysis_carterae.AAC.4
MLNVNDVLHLFDSQAAGGGGSVSGGLDDEDRGFLSAKSTANEDSLDETVDFLNFDATPSSTCAPCVPWSSGSYPPASAPAADASGSFDTSLGIPDHALFTEGLDDSLQQLSNHRPCIGASNFLGACPLGSASSLLWPHLVSVRCYIRIASGPLLSLKYWISTRHFNSRCCHALCMHLLVPVVPWSDLLITSDWHI